MPFPSDSADNIDAQARAVQMQADASPSQESLGESSQWEAVPLPGMFSGNAPPKSATHQGSSSSGDKGMSEFQLLTLVQDLNRCNEVLLSRVNQLEEALETSQQTLQQEVERSQQATEKVSMAQQHSVAQLLSELEQSNEALKRHTILSETLQAQLETAQERSKHLEREYALLQKRHAKKAQHILQAEESCRDLKARLQRQQRYTLQFKAALEKCLDTSAFKQSSVGLPDMAGEAENLDKQGSMVLNPSAMPKSESIQPWSTTGLSSESDPQLRSLMRSTQEPQKGTAPPSSSVPEPEASTTVPNEAFPDQDAEKLLWQDVERIIENSATFSQSSPESRAPTTATSPNEAVGFTEPLPWGVPRSKKSDLATALGENPAKTGADVAVTGAPAAKDFIDDTEERTAPVDAAMRNSPRSEAGAPSNVSVPALEAIQASQASPSPVVHPLRPKHRKRTSLSAVELPSFPRMPKSDKAR